MARTAIVDAASTVANVIEADFGFTLPGFTLVPSDTAGIGDVYDPETGTFAPPATSEPAPEPVPDEVSDRQFFQQLALEGAITQDEALEAVSVGTLPSTLSTALAQIPDPTERFNAVITLVGATTYKRSHPLTGLLGQILDKDGDALDELWRKAAALA